MAKRLFSSPSSSYCASSSPSPSKTPKMDSLRKLQQTLDKGFENLDTHMSAALYKLHTGNRPEADRKLSTCSNLITAMQKETQAKIKLCLLDYESMAQRIHGLEQNTKFQHQQIVELTSKEGSKTPCHQMSREVAAESLDDDEDNQLLLSLSDPDPIDIDKKDDEKDDEKE